ncbi:hypothetical protein A9Q84_08800 [Halobacteriovorax marinus]|uniref:Uncharacterized protein n=1 Tax=Halobacteriovorax marinus TaxID=97084 RepID=A0A1Y5FAC0_9BACT|nr:hypothetical protein A9Q84_08800 [Halobacteriovorax marinus]
MDENKLEEAMAETVEQSFNDSELEDIMNEIENLEKEFVEDGESAPENLVVTETKQNEMQNEIDKEVESISEEMTPVASDEEPVEEIQEVSMAAEPEATIEESVEESFDEVADELVAEMEEEEIEIENNVVELPTAKESPAADSGANMDFTASGSMDFNLNFKIGSETASLKVDGEKGLTVEMGGVSIKITESEGCTVTMDGGVNFNIPLTTADDAAKKKAA